MPDLNDGQIAEVKGSAKLPYILKNTGGVYSCTCPAWRNQSVAIERRTCKHLRAFRGEQAEQDRIGGELPAKAAAASANADAPGLLLAHAWENDTDLTDWWMSEKLDGVRAYWDGRQFISRLGNVYHAPDFFTAGLPEIPLDGELWLGRKAFQRCVSIVRRQDKSDLWQSVRFLVFDLPAAAAPFEERLAQLRERLPPNQSPFADRHGHASVRHRHGPRLAIGERDVRQSAGLFVHVAQRCGAAARRPDRAAPRDSAAAA